MKVGFVGLGKLGLPCALASEAAGHEVMGWDTNVEKPEQIVKWADIVFVAVQTPHQPQFEGTTRLADERADFDYGYLWNAVASVSNAKLIVVISTALPGTIQRELFDDPDLGIGPDRLLYNPFFIAMGTTIPDFRDPEFVLIGTDGAHPGPLREFYASIHDRPVFVTTIKTAELTKVAYNTFIGLKIAFANTMMELCEKTGADVDDLVDALSLADKRLLSPAYLRGGMGDGGGCHPRDNIALSWLAREQNLSYDLFEALMACRERQTEWLAQLIQEEQNSTSAYRPVEILGKAYKPETNLTVGSPATLLSHMLDEIGVDHAHTDLHVDAHDA